MAKLKVFRTPIGFHDAYVAASSQKAALKAWGSDANLFARGTAEQVTEAKLMREPLANPGKVIRVSRGSTTDYIRAEPGNNGGRTTEKAPDKARSAKRATTSAPLKITKKPKLKTRPSRSALDKAEDAITQAKEAHEIALSDLRAREQALKEERRKLDDGFEHQLSRLESARERAKANYQSKIEQWAAEK